MTPSKQRLPVPDNPAYAHSEEFRSLEARLADALPARSFETLDNVALIVIKPDAVASGKADAVFKYLEARGISALDRFGVEPDRKRVEDLYKHSLMLGKLDPIGESWDLILRLAEAGPALGALVGTREREAGFHRRLRAIKGSIPTGATFPAGTLRGDLEATNRTMNLLHTSDDPASSAREYLLFRSMAQLQRALNEMANRWHSPRSHDSAWPTHLGEAGPHLDLDFLRTIVRLRRRLVDCIWRRISPRQLRTLERQSAALQRLVGSYDPPSVRWRRYRAWVASGDLPPGPTFLQASDLGTFRDLAELPQLGRPIAADPIAELVRWGVTPNFWEQLVVHSTLRHRRDLLPFFETHHAI